jgi:hypothetical protein
VTLAFAFMMSAAVQQVDTLTLEPALARAPLSQPHADRRVRPVRVIPHIIT